MNAFQLQPGDKFRISTRRMAASGVVTKVNRMTVVWAADYQPAPDGPVHRLTGKIARGEFARCMIKRGEAIFTILQ